MNNQDILKKLQDECMNDIFSTNAGCKIVEADSSKVICEKPITEKLLAPFVGVVGGAIFTLANFDFEILQNLESESKSNRI